MHVNAHYSPFSFSVRVYPPVYGAVLYSPRMAISVFPPIMFDHYVTEQDGIMGPADWGSSVSGGSKLEDVGTCCPVGGLNHFLEVYKETENSASVRFFTTKVMSNVTTFYKTISHFSIIFFFFFHVLLIKRPVSHRLRKNPLCSAQFLEYLIQSMQP
jgi:hypothetical protein